MDVILALIRFNRENQDYFLFKVKEKHSGLNKISWARTIARSLAFVSDGVPVYLEPVNKKRSIDFDEELLVLYYSILDYVRSHYGFRVKIGIRLANATWTGMVPRGFARSNTSISRIGT